eukprot:5882777-Prymnesium_polylepis.1
MERPARRAAGAQKRLGGADASEEASSPGMLPSPDRAWADGDGGDGGDGVAEELVLRHGGDAEEAPLAVGEDEDELLRLAVGAVDESADGGLGDAEGVPELEGAERGGEEGGLLEVATGEAL